MKRSAVNSGFLPPKEEKPTLMVGSLVVGRWRIGTHNGTIYNADHLFRRLGLPRYAQERKKTI